MQTFPLAKAGLLALALLAGFLIAWEVYLRSRGFENSYNDDEDLWAYHHQQVHQATDANPVMIGSSRIKFGLDLETWRATTGKAPTQLALPGTSPRPILTDLANDPEFKGTVIVGVTEVLFFQPNGSFPEQQATKCVKYYPNWSIARQTGFHLNRALESNLIFLDVHRFNLKTLLHQLDLPNRPAVFAEPPFPLKFTTDGFDRQTYITTEFEQDTVLQKKQKDIWMYLFTKAPGEPPSDSTITSIFQQVKSEVAKITGRGGHVLFVRMPSGGEVLELEKKIVPREKYWDRLLRETGAPGIHFEDYPELSRYECPEWSHLTKADARTFTADFIRVMEQKTGWTVAQPRVAALLPTTTPTLTAR
jgi:hypothetical protein